MNSILTRRGAVDATERAIAEARLAGAFDAIYDAGGPSACLHIIAAMTERLRDRLRAEMAGSKTGRAE